MRKWREFLCKFHSEKEIENDILHYHYEEDSPARLTDHLKWLESVGFKNIDIIWKYYNIMVYGGYK